MEILAVEAIRQIPAFLLAILAFIFFLSARKSQKLNLEPVAISAEFESNVKATADAVQQVRSEIQQVRDRVHELESLKQHLDEAEEAIRSQLANQKMALKEFGRVLSKTSEQTYTDFGSFEERLERIENGLKERGLVGDSRSAAA